MPDVLVCGAVNFDIIMKLPRFPYPGETLTEAHVSYAQGGKGANQAVAAAQAGARTSFIGAIGADEFGARVAAEITENGVDLQLVESAELPTGVAFILVDGKGESSVIVDLGANLILGSEVGERATTISAGDIAVAQNEIPLDATLAFGAAARSVGAVTILNASPFTPACELACRSYEYLIVNEIEFCQLTHQSTDSITIADIESALADGIDIEIPNIIVTVGARGARARIGGEVIVTEGHIVGAVDTTGAGDCFCGSFAAGLARGLSPSQCLVFANAAAAISVQSPGAGPSMPNYASIAAFLQERG